MRELSSCAGCGGTAFSFEASFAGELAADVVEIRRCQGCGDEGEVPEPLDPDLLAASRATRRRSRAAA